jgi:hypothetical protein
MGRLISVLSPVTFLSEQTSHQQPASNTFLSEQTSTSHQPPAKRTGCKLSSLSVREFFWANAFPVELVGIAQADCNPVDD